MEEYTIPHDIKVLGVQASKFPEGIQEAFDRLSSKLPKGDERLFYGISQFTHGGMVYLASAAETHNGEAEKYGLQTFIIEKGNYLAETLTDWPGKIESIKEIFDVLVSDERCDRTKPCVEIYNNMQEMQCLVKMVKQETELLQELENATADLLDQFNVLSQEAVNKVPYPGGWTAAQVLQHVHKSDKGIFSMLCGETKPADRNPAEYMAQIKADFADLSIRMESPEFVLPPHIHYDKERLASSFLRTRTQIKEQVKTMLLSDVCTSFSFPVYGELTRMELIGFVIHHTKRHIHQLQKISKTINI